MFFFKIYKQVHAKLEFLVLQWGFPQECRGFYWKYLSNIFFCVFLLCCSATLHLYFSVDIWHWPKSTCFCSSPLCFSILLNLLSLLLISAWHVLYWFFHYCQMVCYIYFLPSKKIQPFRISQRRQTMQPWCLNKVLLSVKAKKHWIILKSYFCWKVAYSILCFDVQLELPFIFFPKVFVEIMK